MNDEEMEALHRWQSSIDGRTYDCLYTLENIADNLVEASKSREGVKCIREYWPRFIAAKRKLDDLEIEMRQIAEVQESLEKFYGRELTWPGK